jgi:hypothetical protein
MKVFNIFPGKDCNPHCERYLENAVDSIREWLLNGDPGEVVKIEILEMSEEEYSALPEWEGP